MSTAAEVERLVRGFVDRQLGTTCAGPLVTDDKAAQLVAVLFAVLWHRWKRVPQGRTVWS